MLKNKIVAWYLQKGNMSIIPIFDISNLYQGKEDKKKVTKKAGLVYEIMPDWNTGKLEEVRQTYIIVFIDSIYDTEDLARQARDKLLPELIETTLQT